MRVATFWLRVGSAKTWNSQSLPDDDCGDAGGSWQFSRVNCRGKLETRASANRLPGHCGLLYSLLFGAGWAAGRRRGCEEVVLRIIFSGSRSASSTGKCGTPCERCRTSTVGSPLLAAGRQEERSTKRCGGRWLASRRICFFGQLTSPLDFCFAVCSPTPRKRDSLVYVGLAARQLYWNWD